MKNFFFEKMYVMVEVHINTEFSKEDGVWFASLEDRNGEDLVDSGVGDTKERAIFELGKNYGTYKSRHSN